MKKRYLGKIKVSEIGMGCMGFSHGYGQIPDEDYSIEAIVQAIGYGCTFFDTAEAYGPNLLPENRGHNEKILVKAIKASGAKREELVIATKLHLPTDEARTDGVYGAVRRHLEASLSRLDLGMADVYYGRRRLCASDAGHAASVSVLAEWRRVCRSATPDVSGWRL